MRAASAVLEPIDADLRPALVVDCVNGDAAAWRKLHREYYPIAVAFLRKLGVSAGDVEDIAQEVFIETYRHLAGFRGDAQLKTWLYRLCITQARYARRRRALTEALRALLARQPQMTSGSGPLCEYKARRRIELALSKLSEHERTALVLYELEGLPGKQVAEILGCKEATLWRRLHYARQKFVAAFNATTLGGPG
ncbi:MAG TPA: RNA polymerase sigma factor [Polyangiaceae bacterium]|nr:RNA polymerase sigma factor [Polyangiaceae bacterium]